MSGWRSGLAESGCGQDAHGSVRSHARGETPVHAAAKAAFARALRARGLRVALEAPLRGAAEDRRADILVTSPAGERIAIEIQHSPIAVAELLQRTEDYRALGIRVVWVPTIDHAAARPERLASGRLWSVPRFAMPRWHSWIEAQQGGLWYWADDALWRAWSEPLPRSERALVHDRDEEAPSAVRTCALTLEGPFDPQAIRILARAPTPAPDTRFTLAHGASAALLLPGERRAPPAPTRIAWDHGRDGRVRHQIALRCA